MAARVSMKTKRKQAPAWIFPWPPPRESPWPKIAAVLLCAGGFAVLLTSVRVRVAAPVPWAARKAAVIQALDDVDGRALALRAREGGPFPSRFEPATWEFAPDIRQTLAWQPVPYTPVLRELPEAQASSRLATPGGVAWPPRRMRAEPAPRMPARGLVPVLMPLAGIDTDEMPASPPAFGQPVDPAMAAEPWRFLLRLDRSGAVLDCVSLSAGESGKAALESWLRRLSFQPDAPAAERWVSVGIGFINQPADGTDAR